MKTKSVYKVVAFILSLAMLLTGCGGEKKNGNSLDYKEYLNLDSAYPVIKDEYAGTIKLKVALVQNSIGGNWDSLWISQYLKEKYNVEFEVETILDTAVGDRKTLMMSDDDMPDIMIGMNFTTDEVYRYGLEEGKLLACDEYITEELTPNLYRYMQDEKVSSTCILPDGHVYSLPWIFASDDESLYNATYINKAWLDELNIEMPRTLDEFIDAMYAIKKADPAGVGSENVYPFGGGMSEETTNANTYYLLNALGYVTNDDYGTDAALRNGEVVIPAYDLEVYQEFLKIMHQFYEDDIIIPNFFTTDRTESIAQLNNGQTAVFHDEVHSVGYADYLNWSASYPLTSKWSKEAVTANPNTVQASGGFVISANTEYPELCMRIAELWYNNTTDNPRALWLGPGIGTEYDMGYAFIEWDEDLKKTVDVTEKMGGLDVWSYLMQTLVGFQPQFGAVEDTASIAKYYESMGGSYEEKVYDSSNGEQHSRKTTYENVVPYGAEAFPTIYYQDADTIADMTDLQTVINPYIQEQVALFITGRREINDKEITAFKQELEQMGIEELLNMYKDIYNSTK